MTTKATLGLTIALLLVAMILSLKNHSEKKDILRENQYLTQQVNDLRQQVPGGGSPTAMVSDLERRLREVEDRKEAKIAELEKQLQSTQGASVEAAALNRIVEEREKMRADELSPLARKIKAMPAIGKVIEANSDWGILSFSAGSDSGVATGMEFAVRRDHYLIARAKVQTVEEGRSIADIVGSIAEGMQIQPGDDMISYPVQ